MLFTESGGANKGEDGGYVRAAIRNLDEANQAKYAALINSLDKNGRQVERRQGRQDDGRRLPVLLGAPAVDRQPEVQDRLHGQRVRHGVVQGDLRAWPAMPCAGFNSSPYTSPIVNGSCAGNYIIYISNGPVQDNAPTTPRRRAG